MTLRVAPFQVSPQYNSTRIVYETAPYRLEEYVYHRWLVNPGEMIGYHLARDLRESDAFQAVFYGSGDSEEYMVTGSVDTLLERDETPTWEAVLSLNITLMASREPDPTKKILFQREYRTEEPCRQNSPTAFAAAVSEALRRSSSLILEDIYTAIETRRKSSGS